MPRRRKTCGETKAYIVQGVAEVHTCTKEPGHTTMHGDGYKQWRQAK